MSDDGFISRWSRRKSSARSGVSTPDEPVLTPAPVADFQQTIEQNRALAHTESASPAIKNIANEASEAAAPPATPHEAPAPTMEDVKLLTSESDFKPFVAKNVSPEVKNAALKKLFTDPHFNRMDMMDVYVDDYSKPDPMPRAMIKQLAASQFLGLFDDEDKKKPDQKEGAREVADRHEPASVAQSDRSHDIPSQDAAPASGSDAERRAHRDTTASDASIAITHDHHPDLQLQPDHAARREDDRRGTG
jgi:hypothetical protein